MRLFNWVWMIVCSMLSEERRVHHMDLHTGLCVSICMLVFKFRCAKKNQTFHLMFECLTTFFCINDNPSFLSFDFIKTPDV